ncbi:MAG: BON domain-containing protein [Deltaproteobacteria bacterium]|nr:BON domain-containing protein [Deltaproteobacteria bacterium]
MRIDIGTAVSLAIGAFAAGAGLAFFFDARNGGRRRALLRDQLVHTRNVARRELHFRTRDLSNRARGTIAEARRFVAREEVSDDVLVERVRAKLGHVCSHAGAIEVKAKAEGTIELKGPIPAIEYPQVLAAIRLVPGVHHIDDDLEVQGFKGAEPSLQGREERQGDARESIV